MSNQAENEKRVSEQHMMEEQLGEALLDWVTGGTGRVQDCLECSGHLQRYNNAKRYHDSQERWADEYARQGYSGYAAIHKAKADKAFDIVQELYHKIRGHEHVDFP